MYQQASQSSILPPPAIESMMTRLLLTPIVYQEVRALLQDTHFAASEAHLALLWRAMCACYDREHSFNYTQLRDYIHLDMATRGQPPMQLLHILMSEPDGILYWTFHEAIKSPANTDVTMARDLVRMFLTERTVYQSLRMELDQVNAGSHTSIRDAITKASDRQQQISQLDVNPIHAGIPDDWDTAPLQIEPTNLPFLDSWMGGGPAPMEVIGLLGPTGAGKTVLAVNIACSIARTERAKYDEARMAGRQYTPKIAYFVTYEQSLMELHHRLTSCACQIETTRVQSLRRPETDLTSIRHNNLLPYEFEVHRRLNGAASDVAPSIVPGELERYNNGKELLKNYIVVLDLSGTKEKTSRPGTGFVEEIEALIAQHQSQIGNPGVSTVIVDYVNLAVNRYLSARGNTAESALRHAISDYVDKLRFKVAGRFNTHVWALNQLNAKGNSGKPTSTTSHLQAAESSAYAHHLAWCCALGTKDPASNCLTLNFSKQRRVSAFNEPSIIHVIPNMATMEDGRGRFVLMKSTGRIVPVSMASAIQGPEQDEQARAIQQHEIQTQFNTQAAIAGFDA